MHELSIATAVLGTALKHADGQPIDIVAMKVGGLRQVVPSSLQFYWEIVARDTLCDGARLEIEEIAARLRCEQCGHAWEPFLAAFRCEACGDAEVTVLSGNELQVEFIELKERVHA